MKKLLLLLILMLECTAASAAQDHARIRSAVGAFVQQQAASMPGTASFQINEIDQRIVLPECARLEAFLPAGSQLIGKTAVGVRCLEEDGWSIFVPVQVRLSVDLLVSARQLPAGQVLQEGDFARQKTETTRLTGFTDPQQVVGKVLRYGIAAGQVLREDMLRLPYSVTQGQVVQLTVQGRGFTIRSEGVALNNAGEGQAVQVRVTAGRVVGGIARPGGVVEVSP